MPAGKREASGNTDAAGERPVDGVDDERDAEPVEHALPVAARGGNQRKQRQHRARRSKKMDRGRAQAFAHARFLARRRNNDDKCGSRKRRRRMMPS